MKTMYPDAVSFLAEIERLDSLKRDYIVPQGKMSMDYDGSMLKVENLGTYPIGKIAHEQIASRLKIPKDYYERSGSVPGLRAFNVNSWLGVDPKTKRLLRTLDGGARAILSDHFRPLDNMLVAGAAMPMIAKNPDLRVRSAIITPSRMYLQVSFPKIAGEIRVGDVVEYGFTISTSEVGKGKVDAQRWLFQLRCSNGYVGESIFSRRHIGRKIGEDEEDYSIFADDTIEAELKSFQLRLRDLINDAMRPESFEAEIAKFRRADEDTFKHSEAEEIITEVSKHYTFNMDEMKAVFDRVMENTRPSRLAIADAVTNVAQFTEDSDRAYELEQSGYEIIAMSGKDWRDLAIA